MNCVQRVTPGGLWYLPFPMSQPNAPDRRIWIDGRLVPWAEATVHVLSHSHQRGSLIFDYMSVHATARGPAVFRLDDHVRRFGVSAELVGLPLRQDAAAIRAAILEAVRANPGAKAVKVSAYLASVEVDVVPVDEHVTLAVAAYDPVADILRPKGVPARGFAPLRVWVEKERRNRRPDIMPPQAKVAANYASPMAAKWAARKRGYGEILLVDEQGFVAEGPTSNVFLVDREGTLRTPPEDTVLLGVTRRSILDLAVAEGRKVVEERFRPEALFEAAEAFITGTTAGVWPIASVDDHPLPAAPGPVSKALGEHFGRVTRGEDPAFVHWLTFVDEARA
jgi:branched-chain amino acid aminotransferase